MLLPELRKRGIYWDDYCVPGGAYRENLNEKPGQAEPPPDHPAASMIWRPPKAHSAVPNGINGFANGHSSDQEAAIDPVAMQFG